MRTTRTGLQAQKKEAEKIGWFPPQEEIAAYQALLKVGAAFAAGDVATAVAGMELCHRILHYLGKSPNDIQYGFCVYGVVAVTYESQLSRGMVKSCDGCARGCSIKKNKPCYRFMNMIRQPDYETLVSTMEALIGTLGIKRVHVCAICAVAADRDPGFNMWYQKEYLEVENVRGVAD